MKNKLLLTLAILLSNWLGIRAQVPLLNSYPSANAAIYIDFDGQTVTGTPWNWSGPIYAQPADITPTGIAEIFNRVSEDFRPFNVNVTTDSTKYWSAPALKRIRIVVTPTYEWYTKVGGVAFVGSFVFGDNTPAWVFSSLLYNNPKYVSEAISHEAGHTLGLQHQSDFDTNCTKIREYSSGIGTGEIGWAPIMGVGYNKNVTTWHYGTNTAGCDTWQDDFSIINSTTNGFGLRSDDHSNNSSSATPIIMAGSNFGLNGLINNATDVDVFSLNVIGTNHFSLDAIPQNVGPGNLGANVDIQVILLNSTGDTIARYNPSTLLNAGIDTTLSAGTYYLSVDGIGNIYHNDYGSLGFYQIQGFLGSTVLAFNNFVLNVQKQNKTTLLSWSYQTDDNITALSIETSSDGIHFAKLAQLKPSNFQFTTPTQNSTIYYRLRAFTANNTAKAYLSNIVALLGKITESSIRINSKKGQVNVYSKGNYFFQLINSNGQLLQSGVLKIGNNQISTGSATGLMMLQFGDGKNLHSERFIQ